MDVKQRNESEFNLHGYISNNIDYVSYLVKGYFIVSDAIENANKTILQKRLKPSWDALECQ